MGIKRFLKQSLFMPLAIAAYNGRFLLGCARYFVVCREFSTYRHLLRKQGTQESLSVRDFYPWLIDKYRPAGKADLYFYQDTWCAKKVFSIRPKTHVDVGSAMITVGILSQFTELIYVDMRPISINLPGFGFRQGNLLSLPFESNSVESLSSLSVVEHVGLGRYGDPLDPLGTDKACAEMARVIRPGGSLYVAVPTQRQASTHFNAHRIFVPDSFVAKFPGLTLLEERYGTGEGIFDRQKYEEMGMPHAYGCFHFTK